MAAIDKIYLTLDQYPEWMKFVRDNAKKCKKQTGDEIEKYLYGVDSKHLKSGNKTNFPVSNFPEHIDMWLLDKCPLPFIQKRIKEQYSIE